MTNRVPHASGPFHNGWVPLMKQMDREDNYGVTRRVIMICEEQCGIRVIGYRLKLSCVDLNILVRIKFGNGTIKKKTKFIRHIILF